MIVGRRSFTFWLVDFQGRDVKLPGSIALANQTEDKNMGVEGYPPMPGPHQNKALL